MRPRPRPALAAFALLVFATSAQAGPTFTWQVEAAFAPSLTIGGQTVAGPVVISGRTDGTLGGVPWLDDPVTAPLELSSLSLTYDGGAPVAPDLTRFFTYGLLGDDAQMKSPPAFRFFADGDFATDTPLDSVVFKLVFGGVDAWIGFGGQTGRNIGITTTLTDTAANPGVVDFSEGVRLQLLRPADSDRSAVFSGIPAAPPAQPIPLPAGALLLATALGGLALRGARRPA